MRLREDSNWEGPVRGFCSVDNILFLDHGDYMGVCLCNNSLSSMLCFTYFPVSAFLKKIYLFDREREKREKESTSSRGRERESQADSPLSMESDVGSSPGP